MTYCWVHKKKYLLCPTKMMILISANQTLLCIVENNVRGNYFGLCSIYLLMEKNQDWMHYKSNYILYQCKIHKGHNIWYTLYDSFFILRQKNTGLKLIILMTLYLKSKSRCTFLVTTCDLGCD